MIKLTTKRRGKLTMAMERRKKKDKAVFDASDIEVKFSNKWHDIVEIEATVYEKDIPMYNPPKDFAEIRIPCRIDQVLVLKEATITYWTPAELKEFVAVATKTIYIKAKRAEIEKYDAWKGLEKK